MAALDARVLAEWVDGLDEGILVLDPSFRVVTANARAREILSRKLADLKGRLPWTVLADPNAARLSEACHRAAIAREVVSVPWTDPVPSARFEVRIAPTSVGLIVQFRDISRLEPAREAQDATLEQIEGERSFFRAIVDQMPSGAIVAAPSGKLLFGNRRFEAIFGGEMLGADSVEGYRGYTGYHPDGRRIEPSEWPLARSLSTGETVADERIDFVRQDGKRIVTRLRSSPVYDDEHRLIGGVVFVDDVTAEAAAVRDLVVTKALLEGIMDHSPALIFAKDPEGRYLFANRRWSELFADTDTSFVGHTDYEVFPKELADAFRAADRRAFDENAALAVEEVAPGGDGLHTYLSVKFPVRDEKGKVYAIGGVATDLTARKAIEVERDAYLALLDTFLEASPVGFGVIDTSYRYTRVNEALARVHGLPAKEHIGKTQRELFPHLPNEIERSVAHVLEGGAPVTNLEIAYVTPAEEARALSGGAAEPHHFLCSCYPIRVAGQIQAAGMVVVDITEQKRLASQLLREGELRELFMAVLAHDLRNPLSSISLGALSLQSSKTSADMVRRAQIIVNSARRMGTLIEQLLDFSRVRFGATLPLHRRACDLCPVVAHVVSEVEWSHPERKIAFSAVGDTNGTWDPDRLSQVASNLVNNAATYAFEKTTVAVDLVGREDEVSFSVRNEGPAIPPAKLAKIFEPFERASLETRSSTEGLGLGLYIADQIVRAHGGTIAATSTPGATVFEVHLPRAV